MLRSILVGLDGSTDSDAAVELGIKWARKFDCLLVGVGVVDEPTFRGQQPISRMTQSYKLAYDRMIADARVNVEQFLSQFALRCSSQNVAHKLLENVGLPDEQITIEAQRYDLIMLGREANFHFETQKRDCDTLQKVLRSACRPVVVVSASPDACQEVIVAYDGSVQAARSLHAFVASGLHELGLVRVVCVHPESKVDAAKTADRAIEYLRFHGVEAQSTPIVSQNGPGDVFVDEAIRQQAGLVVMGAFGQSRIRELLLGSATCTALRKSPIPLFLYH